MKMLKVVVLILCFVGNIGAKKTKGLNQEWLQRDIEIVHLVKRMFPFHTKTASELIILCQGRKEHYYEAKELGFGAILHTITLLGGYTTIHITLLAHHDRIAHLRLQQKINSTYTEDLFHTLSPIWGATVTLTEQGFLYEFEKKQVFHEFQQAIYHELGIPPPPPPPPQLPRQEYERYQEAYQLLMNPLAQYDYGTYCYYAGAEPEGRKAINLLTRYAPLPVLRVILRSPNPEGRMYAIEALLNINIRGEQIRLLGQEIKAIQKLLDLEIPISICNGCIVSRSTARKILANSP